MHDMLRETRAFQEIMKEGLQEGLEKGRQEGKIQALLTIVKARFPRLVNLAKGVTTIIEKPEVLDDLIFKMSTAQTLEEAQQYLIKVSEEQ